MLFVAVFVLHRPPREGSLFLFCTGPWGRGHCFCSAQAPEGGVIVLFCTSTWGIHHYAFIWKLVSVHSFSRGVLKSGIDNLDWIVKNTQHVLVLYDVLERALSKGLTLWKYVFGVCENVYFVYVWTDLVDFSWVCFYIWGEVYSVYLLDNLIVLKWSCVVDRLLVCNY